MRKKQLLWNLACGGVIAGLFFGGLTVWLTWSVGDPRTVQTTETDFMAFVSHLKAYEINGGHYPTTEQGLEALAVMPLEEPLPRKWVQSIPRVPRDPWGQEYRYQFPGRGNPEEPEILSAGPDGLWQTGDDLSSQD